MAGIVEDIIENLFSIRCTIYDLPKGALTRSDDIYVVTGRCDRGTEYPQNKPELYKGNPIDIMGYFIQKKDYFSCNRNNQITNNWGSNRRLILASELENNRANWRFIKEIKFQFKDGILVPEETSIQPKEICDGFDEILEPLKTKKGFEKEAIEILKEEKVKSLVDHLF